MIHKETKQENEILLVLEKKEVESMPNLEIMLPVVSQSHSYALHYPNLGIEMNNTKEALFSFSMSRLRNEVLYGVLPLSACQILLGGLWLFHCYVSYNGHDSYKYQGQALAISSLPPPH